MSGGDRLLIALIQEICSSRCSGQNTLAVVSLSPYVALGAEAEQLRSNPVSSHSPASFVSHTYQQQTEQLQLWKEKEAPGSSEKTFLPRSVLFFPVGTSMPQFVLILGLLLCCSTPVFCCLYFTGILIFWKATLTL